MFKGSIVALATPFNAQGEVDFECLRSLIEWHIESATDAILVCGITGEAPTLSDAETAQIFKESVLAAKGRIPLIAGTGSCDTARSVRLTEEAKKVGMDAALVIFPYFNRPSPEGCLRHFQELSKVEFPLIVYDHPGRTGIKPSINTLCALSKLPNVVGIKDSAADLDHTLELLRRVEIPLLCGDDSLLLPMMSSGAVGVVSIVANIIPREWKILTTLMLSDEVGEGREYFQRYQALVKSMVLETNPQCVKFALSALGKCSSHLRLPLIEPQEAHKQQILTAIINAGLLLHRNSPLVV